MFKTTIIRSAFIINENKIEQSDIKIVNERIESIAKNITPKENDTVINAEGLYLIPGMIDDQVHFREPGLTHKGSIKTESIAAIAGGITSFMEMPNVNPPTVNKEAIYDKLQRASQVSLANFSFYLGATNNNLEDIKSIHPNLVCGVKVFMGASTGNMLVDDRDILEGIFTHSPVLIATHCEDTPMIMTNEKKAQQEYGEQVPFSLHADIRSREACIKSTKMAIELAKKHQSKLHVLHITTKEELALFKAHKTLESLKNENITAEACVHHLFFDRKDYDTLGAQIKCNPSIKETSDRLAILQAINNDIIDIIATDHAPHTKTEKAGTYFNAPSGLPLVQHALLSLLEHYHKGILSLEKIVQKTSHAVAERYQIKDRGYIREGYYADLTLIDLNHTHHITQDELLYLCKWSPFDHYTFSSKIISTFVNGHHVYDNGRCHFNQLGKQLEFNRN